VFLFCCFWKGEGVRERASGGGGGNGNGGDERARRRERATYQKRTWHSSQLSASMAHPRRSSSPSSDVALARTRDIVVAWVLLSKEGAADRVEGSFFCVLVCASCVET
jgi:hypothetical protein